MLNSLKDQYWLQEKAGNSIESLHTVVWQYMEE